MSIVAKYRGTKVTVNTTGIQSLFEPTGGVAKHGKRVGKEIKYNAIANAPVRTGDLKNAHTGPFYSRTWLACHITVGNTSDHARFVHEGVKGRIYPHNPTGYLWIRPYPHSRFAPNFRPFPEGHLVNAGGRTPLRSVRGQEANPWLADAMRLVVKLAHI